MVKQVLCLFWKTVKVQDRCGIISKCATSNKHFVNLLQTSSTNEMEM